MYTNYYNLATACVPDNETSPVLKDVGDSIDFRCLDSSPCHGDSYIFYHNLSTGEIEEVHHGSYKFITSINSLADAGGYCCIKECARNLSLAYECKCHWKITGE